MKRTPLLFAALTPFAVAAGGGDPSAGSASVDKQKLQDSVSVSKITEMNVTGQDGRIIGEIEDVVLDTDGRVAGLVVDREIEIESDLQYGDQRESGEDIAQADVTDDTTTVDAHEGAGDEADGAHATLDWSQVSYDRNADAVLLTGTDTTMSTIGHHPESASAPSGRLHASELIGMDVNLADGDGYGEVEDVLVDPQSGHAVALVVDAGGVFDSRTIAVPVELDNVDPDEEEVTLQRTREEMDTVEEVDLEGLVEST